MGDTFYLGADRIIRISIFFVVSANFDQLSVAVRACFIGFIGHQLGSARVWDWLSFSWWKTGIWNMPVIEKGIC